jgi:hypothetical protein
MSQKKAQLLNPINGNINVSGIVTATSFVGSGEGLTGVASTDNIQTSTSAKFLSNVNISGITTVGIVTGGTSVSATHFYGDGSALTGIDASSIAFGGDVKAQAVGTGVVVTGVLTATTMSASNAVFDGNVTVGGTITYQDATSIDVIGISTFQQGIQILANGANIAGIVTVGVTTIKSGEIEVVGVITATSFSGDGSALTGIAVGLNTDTASPNNTIVFLDLSNAQDHKLITSGITTISCTGGKEGESHTVRITNSGITTIGFTTAFLFPSGSTPSLPTADGAISLISFTINKAGTAGTELLAGASLNFS